MPTKPCRGCYREIKSDLLDCPHCGFKNKSETGRNLGLFLLSLLFIAVVLMLGNSLEWSKKAPIENSAEILELDNSCLVGKSIKGYFSVNQAAIYFYEKPSKKAKRVKSHYANDFRELNPAYDLKAECENGSWIYAQIVGADKRQVSWEKGWLEKKYISELKQTISYMRPANNLDECRENGIQYFKSIYSWPTFSDGRAAMDVVRERCLRTVGAFDGIDLK